ncbi:hypothetical protein EDC04DRAFT_2615689 [Pisolithus marmoratus]|nr:hypothetical protein EDC04DRAFT_2615689 [Pisolithus marmoratus]
MADLSEGHQPGSAVRLLGVMGKSWHMRKRTLTVQHGTGSLGVSRRWRAILAGIWTQSSSKLGKWVAQAKWTVSDSTVISNLAWLAKEWIQAGDPSRDFKEGRHTGEAGDWFVGHHGSGGLGTQMLEYSSKGRRMSCDLKKMLSAFKLLSVVTSAMGNQIETGMMKALRQALGMAQSVRVGKIGVWLPLGIAYTLESESKQILLTDTTNLNGVGACGGGDGNLLIGSKSVCHQYPDGHQKTYNYERS